MQRLDNVVHKYCRITLTGDRLKAALQLIIHPSAKSVSLESNERKDHKKKIKVDELQKHEETNQIL